jgi:hypothetical protein
MQVGEADKVGSGAEGESRTHVTFGQQILSSSGRITFLLSERSSIIDSSFMKAGKYRLRTPVNPASSNISGPIFPLHVKVAMTVRCPHCPQHCELDARQKPKCLPFPQLQPPKKIRGFYI